MTLDQNAIRALTGQDLTDAAADHGLNEYDQGAIEDQVAALLSLDPNERCVQEITEMVIRHFVDGANTAIAARIASEAGAR